MPVSSYLLNPLRSLEQARSELGRDDSSASVSQETDADERDPHEPVAPAERQS
ncbi:hypothetical protein JL100_007110 [Skermanella mucosa]|uniref:hypothetical protein n=1 Tax=Skermanella mucosa TaxID=1789672 RepID=UPI00192BB78B|nr:hypothetical protein [Skermanella mucosa]UEM22509.1 hypothetical protein JL100_007110 [Skermanella mucosa]